MYEAWQAKELEKHIATNKYDFQPDSSLETDVIIDILSKIRQYPNLETLVKLFRWPCLQPKIYIKQNLSIPANTKRFKTF